MTTAKDIAALLNLSVSTVGRALADDPRISAETKRRVAQAAAETGYVANRAARMMRGASSNIVGLVVPDIRNTFYSTVAHALSESVAAQGFQLMLSETGDDRQAELRQLRGLVAAQVAGVIVVPTARPHPDAVRLLASVPHVQLLRSNPALGAQWFGIDDRHALHLATTHLLERGHRRIGYVGGLAALPTGAARLRGFREALAGARLSESAGPVELGQPSSVEEGRAAVHRLLDAPRPPTALVTASIQMTHGMLAALTERRAKVPAELSVVGFGDEPGFSWWGPGLTTVGLPMRELATACGVWLLHRLATASAGDQPYAAVSTGSLIERGSTARVKRKA